MSPPPPAPMLDVNLRLVQRDRTWTLDVADAGTAENNRLGWVKWEFEVPLDARRGPTRLLPEQLMPSPSRPGDAVAPRAGPLCLSGP